MSARTDWNLEQYILLHFKSRGLAKRVRFFPYVSYTVRGPKDSTRWQAGRYDANRGMIIKYDSELASAQTFEGKIQIAEDWRRLARSMPSLFSRLALTRPTGKLFQPPHFPKEETLLCALKRGASRPPYRTF